MDGHLGLASSTNNGTNWTYLDTPFSNTGFSEVRAIDTYDSQVLVCAKRFGDTHFKIYYSSNNGSLWRECTKAGFRFPNATYVALNPHQRGHFWVATNGRSYARFTPGAMGEWQQQFFDSIALNEPSISGPTADPDGDGQTNDFEFVAGVIPTDWNSRFIQNVGQTPEFPTQMQLQFSPRLTDRIYTVETSTTLGGWLPLTGFNTSDVGNVRTIIDPNATDDAKFYRVKIVKP